MTQVDELCDKKESFNSFLAGVLLTTSSIKALDFFKLMNVFEVEYDVTVVSFDTMCNDSDLCIPIYLDDNMIRLPMSIDNNVCVNGVMTTVRQYLLSVASPRIKEFFEIPDIKIEVNSKNDTFEKKTISFVKKLCKFKKKTAV